jgi:arabinose-5-phosphate isomerase
LGRRLLLLIGDIMHTGDRVPQVGVQALLPDALLEMTHKGLGMTAVVDEQGRLAGIFTDGDLRRVLDRGLDIHNSTMQQVMTTGCTTARADQLAAEALQVMEEKKINALLVLDDQQRLIGAFNMHDLLRAGVV